jgi:hypothetical protein
VGDLGAIFDILATDWLHRCRAVFRCVLICYTNFVLCCDVNLLIGYTGSEGSFVA